MQIVAVLAAFGATMGQPDDPPDQDVPPAEQQQRDADTQPAEEHPQAEQPDANGESIPADEQPAEQQQQAEVESSRAGEQPAETGSDDASAGLDEATGWRGGSQNWVVSMRNFGDYFVLGAGRHYGPFTVERMVNRQPALHVYVTVQGSRTPEQWDGVEEQVRTWMCAMDGRAFTNFGGVLVMHVTDEAGASRTVTISEC